MPIAKKKPKEVTVYRTFASYRSADRSRTVRHRIGLHTSKRRATRYAKRMARGKKFGVHPRQVSVYTVPPGQRRGSLLYQVHYSPKLRRLIAEEL